MELVELEKDTPDNKPLRLVSDNREPQQFPLIEKQFVNFIFFRVSPDWRKQAAETKTLYKQEFESVFNDFSREFLLFSYSLVGFDSKADLMFWRIGDSLDLLQDMTAKLYRTSLGSYFETADNYLSITKKRVFVTGGDDEDRRHVQAGEKKYL